MGTLIIIFRLKTTCKIHRRFKLFKIIQCHGALVNFDSINFQSINFETIINNHAESNFYTQSLFTAYSIYNRKNALEGDEYKEIILEQYPQSDYAKMIIENEQLNLEHEPS